MPTDDRLSAALEEIRKRAHVADTYGFHALGAEDVPRLLAAVEAVLALAVRWDKAAKRLDNRADRTDGDMAASLYAQAQAHQDLATAIRDAITSALLPEEDGNG